MSQGQSTRPSLGKDSDGNEPSDRIVMCSSCDRCRAKKIKCDGNKPCEACVIAYIRRNRIKNASQVDKSKISCVYSPAKRRGPPRKGSKEEKRRRMQQAREDEVDPTLSSGQVPDQAALTAAGALNNTDAAAILNLLGSLTNPGMTVPAIPPPIDPLSALLQQSLLPSLTSSAGVQNVGIDQLVGGSSAGTAGYNVANTVPNITQQLAYLQQQAQQQTLLRQLQDHLQQALSQQGQNTSVTESLSSTSPVGDTNGGGELLQDEVGRLRRRVYDLENENMILKQQLGSFITNGKQNE